MKWSIEAGANCTDLTMVLTALSKAEGKTRLENFKNTILANLKKQGIEAIHKYRDDYETVSKNFQNAVGYAKEAEQDFNDDKKDSCNEKMQHANNELDELIILGNRKLNELVDELQEAYTYLGQIGK
jgi:translation initiation factor 2 beta subunit (eIF-2beta)/eIF-5